MAKSMLTTINQVMSIASKAHYMNGGNASKILAKDKKGIFTIEQVANTLECDPVELKQVLQQNKIMCGDYVIVEEWGDGEKLSTYALRTLNDTLAKYENQAEQTPSTLFYVIMIGILCGVCNTVFNAWYIGLFIGLFLCWLIKNEKQIDGRNTEAQQKLQDSLEEGHKAEGMM